MQQELPWEEWLLRYLTGCEEMISIVVPIYNGENYIEDCVRSILAQTYQDWELILVDNASEDSSLSKCKDFAAKDDRIEVLQQHRNMGVSAARNLGIEKTRGEFITFIDIDDWVNPDYLEKLMAIQQKKNAEMVVCEYSKVYDSDRELLRNQRKVNGNLVKQSLDSEHNIYQQTVETKNHLKMYDTKEYLEKYFLNGNTHCWGVLFDRNLLHGIYFPKGVSIGEDMLFLLEVAQNAKQIVVTDYEGYNYYINESGAMKKKFTASYMDQIICWERALKMVSDKFPQLIDKMESILVVSVLLVIGKMSELTDEERKQYIEEEHRCRETFMKYGTKKEIGKFLPKGYPTKIFVYRYFPKLYMSLYGKIR